MASTNPMRSASWAQIGSALKNIIDAFAAPINAEAAECRPTQS
jgi:hypothetical protein